MSGMSSSCDAANAGRCFRFAIDRGGTFTDIYAEVPAQPPFRVLKLLSEDPTNYADAPREGIRRILEEVTGVPHPKDEPLDTSRIQYIRMVGGSAPLLYARLDCHAAHAHDFF